MSDGYDDGGGHDGGYDGGQEHYEHGQAEYGQEQQHDLQYGAVAQSEAEHHDVGYEHGHHVEYDTPGTHYDEEDITAYGEHDDASANLQAVELGEHDQAAAFGDESLTEFDAQHVEAFFEEHGLEAPDHMELPAPDHAELPDAGHAGQGAPTGANPYNTN
jgi:hypothetical protein